MEVSSRLRRESSALMPALKRSLRSALRDMFEQKVLQTKVDLVFDFTCLLAAVRSPGLNDARAVVSI